MQYESNRTINPHSDNNTNQDLREKKYVGSRGRTLKGKYCQPNKDKACYVYVEERVSLSSCVCCMYNGGRAGSPHSNILGISHLKTHLKTSTTSDLLFKT